MKNSGERQFLNRIIVMLIVLILITSGILMYVDKLLTYKVDSMKPNYHFYFIGQNKVDPFWQEVIDGVRKGAEEYNVMVEYNAPRFTNIEEQLKYIDIAVLSNVDGIITHTFNNKDYREVIDRAKEKGIPVIVVENDLPNSNIDAFVGANSFQLGEKAAKLMIKATGGIADIAVIEGGGYEDNSSANDNKINGFISSLKDSRFMNVIETKSSKLGILSAEEITANILKNNESVDAIYTTNSIDTMGAAQAIIDHNKVGKVKLVGYGDTEEIKRLIEQGVVYGTIIGNPNEIGLKSVETLVQIKEGKSVSTFIDTGFRIIK
ncbi:substrate-binding domain-containing protein [Oceanirhabdus sp. W0125-5]|uniref:substrate-binding domain-containing protein n=1 Tax=Oceanirhabdus sp. W0125-5 TaxID=2999116 RepID=UPI0022F2DACA|nr:substrate-binding domain-containing protein [Oceanirhabdus sp. W0125-5]WBW98225.1 substrate-binding domain-containing protein [Oceanirhabdus sp. W0125-5]